MMMALRGRPRCVVFDARLDGASVLAACRRLKADSYTGIVPSVVICNAEPDDFSAAWRAEADEVLRPGLDAPEVLDRLQALLKRSERDTRVHPSTRLPGAHQIEADILKRIGTDEKFAMCYCDLDHFKEYNDRYSYAEGDRIIRIVAKLLHDVAKGVCGESAFVGHIGGDDFIVIIPADRVKDVCGLIVEIFDTLIVLQYSEQDRRLGYFMGKDRRGQLHRVPLMTMSIGVVTNERRRFTHAGQVSALAAEMKGYAKSQQGSLYAVDRRSDDSASSPRNTGENQVAEIE
jgi:diguanylate cyclase (GGDEF)-like protein